MSFVQLQNICVSYGDRDLLRNVNLTIDSRSRIALAGDNGSGKTTLLKIGAGLLDPDSGDLSMQKGSNISYLPQSGLVFSGRSLLEEADQAFKRFHALADRKREIELELGEFQDGDEGLEQLLHDHDELQQSLLRSEYYDREQQIRRVLIGLGFEDSDLTRDTSEFSGGWQMRIGLAKVLLADPDIVFLDEPTNYLDIEARTWLEQFLESFPGGVVVVSHDRYFLDVTVTSVAELFRGSLNLYPGNYTAYHVRRTQELDAIYEAYKQQQAEIERLESFIRRFRSKPTKASQVQSRVKQLEKMELIEIPESMKRIAFSFPEAPHSGKIVLRLEDLSKRYGDLRVINDLNLVLERGEKLVVAGRNGAGKSTLMRIIAGVDSDYSGTMRLGAGVTVGYFSQNLSNLPKSGTVLEAAAEGTATADLPRLRDLLGAFLFRGDDVFKPVTVLSGGEASRLALLKLLLHPANLLVLDEPTNHLDMASKNVLLDALKAYTGTLLFVSHDRYFIEAIAESVLGLKDGGWKLYPGDYEYYLWKTEQEQNQEQEESGPGDSGSTSKQTGAAPSEAPGPPDAVEAGGQSSAVTDDAQSEDDQVKTDGDSTAAEVHSGPTIIRSDGSSSGGMNLRPAGTRNARQSLDRDDEKRLKSRLRKLTAREDEILSRLEGIDAEHDQCQHALSLEKNYTDGEAVKKLTAKLQALEAERDDLNTEWSSIESETNAIRDRFAAEGRSI